MREGHIVNLASSKNIGTRPDNKFSYLFEVEYFGVPKKNILAKLNFYIKYFINGRWEEDNFSYHERFTLSDNEGNYGLAYDRHFLPADPNVECGTVDAYISYAYAAGEIDQNKNFSMANSSTWSGGGGKYSGRWNGIDIGQAPQSLEEIHWDGSSDIKFWGFKYSFIKDDYDEIYINLNSYEIP